MNPRTKRTLQKSLAVTLYGLGIVALIFAFVPIQYPYWWPKLPPLPSVSIPWWPVVVGISPFAHYSARIFLTLAFGLTIFLPQVEGTFVSLMRRRSPIGAPFIDRKDLACPHCGKINRPSVQYCVGCGSPIMWGTRHWDSSGVSQSRLLPFVKLVLAVTAMFSFMLGIFDLTIFLLVTRSLGVDSASVALATLLSTLPSLAGFVALKEGVFRRYSSLKQFDKLVFGKTVWLLFGLLFIGLSIASIYGSLNLSGVALVFWIQVLAGISLVIHPFIRSRLPREATLAYA